MGKGGRWVNITIKSLEGDFWVTTEICKRFIQVPRMR